MSFGLSLYVHIPFCLSKCAYCDFYSRAEPVRDDVIDAAIADCMASRPDTPWRTVYLGGGTPSLLSGRQLERLCRAVGPCDGEYTVEVNPGCSGDGFWQGLANSGINRVSVGAQSFADPVLKRIGRPHRAADIARAVERTHRASIDNIGLDLICGLPEVDRHLWRDTLNAALALSPCHLSIYPLTIAEGPPLAEDIAAGRLSPPDDDTVLCQLDDTEQRLTKAGFHHYEIANWALPEHEGRHNLRYWEGADYIGVGPAAVSTVGLQRTTRFGEFDGYVHAVRAGQPSGERENLTPAERRFEMLMTGLRKSDGVDLKAWRQRWGHGVDYFYHPPLKSELAAGRLRRKNDRLFIPPAYRWVGNDIIRGFSP